MLTLLDDLLAERDFYGAAQGLGRAFREKHALPEVYQLGLVVPNVEKAAASLESKGVKPFFISEGTPAMWKEQAKIMPFRGKLGMAYHQGIQLELLEPGTGSEFYHRSLDKQGRVVVDHLGLSVDGVYEWASKLVKKNYPIAVEGKIRSGPLAIDFVYMDTIEEAGFTIEFISTRFFWMKHDLPPWLVHSIGRLQKKYGKRCLSL